MSKSQQNDSLLEDNTSERPGLLYQPFLPERPSNKVYSQNEERMMNDRLLANLFFCLKPIEQPGENPEKSAASNADSSEASKADVEQTNGRQFVRPNKRLFRCLS